MGAGGATGLVRGAELPWSEVAGIKGEGGIRVFGCARDDAGAWASGVLFRASRMASNVISAVVLGLLRALRTASRVDCGVCDFLKCGDSPLKVGGVDRGVPAPSARLT